MPPKKDFIMNKAQIVSKLKILVTRFQVVETFASQITDENQPTNVQIVTRVTTIKNLYNEYENLLEKFSLVPETEEEQGQFIEDLVKGIETKYLATLSNLTALLPVEPKTSEINDQKTQTIKLPDVNIPVFDGKPTEWLTFKETFSAVIHLNEKLSNVIKFTYLLDKIKGEAKQTIGHISLSDAGYIKAWKDLMDRYDNKRQIVGIHIDGILNLPIVAKDNSLELRQLLNECNSHISSLESLDQKIDGLSEIFIINSITKKIDSNLKKDWETELKTDELPTWVQFQLFLSKKSRILECIEPLRKNSIKPTNPNQQKNVHSKTNQCTFVSCDSTNSTSSDNSNFSSRCIFCKMPFHPFYLCTEFKKLSVENRIKKIKELNLCFNCFSSKHTSKDCPKGSCKYCPKKHNSLLDREKVSMNDPCGNTVQDNKNATTLVSHLVTQRKSLFPTAMILIQDKFGKWHEGRALLDSASDAYFISKEFCQTFNLNTGTNRQATITSLNNRKTVVHEIIEVNVKSSCNNYSKTISCSVVPTIVSKLPDIDLNISRWSLPSSVKLADPYFNISRKIDILIGNELFFEILQSKQIKLKPNLPILQKSVLGWLIVGPFFCDNYANFLSLSNSIDEEIYHENSELNNTIGKFWEMESFPNKKFLSESEKKCEKHFLENHSRDATGRYVVSIPLTEQLNDLGDSKTRALKRFLSLEKKLNADQDLKDQYFQFIKEYISLNHMKKISKEKDCDISNFYLPHHGVLKLSSTSTKLRVDASAKSSTNLSLNDVMLIGPTVQENLFNIILWFRKYPIVMTADISKMYRQINIEPNQTKFQRILWRFDQSEPIDTYELQTVTYGTASAPYLATRVLNQLAEDEKDKFPIVSKIVPQDFYVDDILTGVNSIDEGNIIQAQLIEMLSLGGFELHKWCSNSEDLLANIPMKNRETLKKDEFSSQESIKTLGLLWKPRQDLFYFNVQPSNINAIPTKRFILSDIAKIYDPLGLLSPVTITAKILIQSLWKTQCDWDDVVPPEIARDWSEFSNQLSNINDINFKRCIMPSNPLCVELHGFSDSSERAYGAAIYLRCIDDKNQISVNLVCSKTRVAPLKPVSIPRLELCAALLLSRLTSTVINSLNLAYNRVVLWSDSTITLQWLKIEPHKLKTFVANRVNEIQELTQDYEWKHVSSINNAADVISRGTLPNELKSLYSWWNGPSFLNSSENINNFSENDNLTFDETDLELRY